MPQRLFLSETWSIDEWFADLGRDQRYLFIYLWSNDHVNQAGAYRLPLRTMAFETKFTEEELRKILPSLAPKVKWFPEDGYVWVKNFLKYQAKSPKFLVAAAKCLKEIKNNGLVKELIDYNWKRHRVSIPYEYPTDRVSIHTDTDPDTDPDAGKEKGVVKGEGKTKLAVAPKGAGDSHRAEGDEAVISVWRSVKGFTMSPADASALVATLRTEFAALDILEESKAWAARKLSEPLKRGSKPSQQIWNWMRMARKITQERRQGEQAKVQRVKGSRPASDFRGRKW